MKSTLSPANHHLIDDSRVANVQRPLSAADAHHSLLATSRNWSAGRIERDAQYINQPTLIVWGEDDKVIPIQNGYKLHEAILHSHMVVLRDCGHIPQEEKAELFTDLVSRFCHDRKGHIAAGESEEVRIPEAV